jgi:hypothetical protein
MKTKVLTNPQSIVATLRQYFVDHNVDTFERDEENFFGFLTRLDGTGVLIHAEVGPPALCVRIETTLLCRAEVSLRSCHHLANTINALAQFIRVAIDEESRRFEIESWLVLGDAQCLPSQVTALAASHMSGLAQFAPMIGRFARVEITLVECIDRLELMRALHASGSEEDDLSSSRGGRDEATLPPRWRN